MDRPTSDKGETPSSADGVTQRNPSIPASEEGTGIVPGDDDSASGGETSRPASEADTGQIEDDGGGPAVSWPGRGGPGTIPPPG